MISQPVVQQEEVGRSVSSPGCCPLLLPLTEHNQHTNQAQEQREQYNQREHPERRRRRREEGGGREKERGRRRRREEGEGREEREAVDCKMI